MACVLQGLNIPGGLSQDVHRGNKLPASLPSPRPSEWITEKIPTVVPSQEEEQIHFLAMAQALGLLLKWLLNCRWCGREDGARNTDEANTSQRTKTFLPLVILFVNTACLAIPIIYVSCSSPGSSVSGLSPKNKVQSSTEHPPPS